MHLVTFLSVQKSWLLCASGEFGVRFCFFNADVVQARWIIGLEVSAQILKTVFLQCYTDCFDCMLKNNTVWKYNTSSIITGWVCWKKYVTIDQYSWVKSKLDTTNPLFCIFCPIWLFWFTAFDTILILFFKSSNIIVCSVSPEISIV
jgi:hypothetical protein